MKRLSSDQLERAVSFLKTQARPLERALYTFHFEDGDEAAVIEQLACFRNPDGGFGHALEPDVHTPSSSALATGIALRYITEMDCPEGDHLLPGAIDYLLGTLDRTNLSWRPVPEDVNDAPHAPWWYDEGESLARTFDDFRIIPRVLIVGSLQAYAALVPRNLLDQLTDSAIQAIAEMPVLGTGGGSDLEYVAYLAEAPGLPQATRDLLKEQVMASVKRQVVDDPSQWSGYCLTPLRAAPRPTSLGADGIRQATDAHLDWTLDHQASDGAWDPTWSWGDSYPKTWAQAQAAWRGILTLDTLLSLRAFRRL